MTYQDSFLRSLKNMGPKITLIGMSGLGKSHWSTILEKTGYTRLCCDTMIADRLLNACDTLDGKERCLGQWMGLPFTPGYKEREKAYLDAESDLLLQIIAYLEKAGSEEKIVIDTTGSAPYTGDVVMMRLRALTRMIHLATSSDLIDVMANRYIRSPRPVVWGDVIDRKPFESDHDALLRCYKDLLAYRETLYRKYAHQTVPFDVHRIGRI